MKILVTGAAGFIGSNLLGRLASRGDEVVGLDNINDYYDVRLKYGRLCVNGFDGPFEDGRVKVSSKWSSCRFVKLDICDKAALDALFAEEHFDTVVNLAAQAGVRYSITNPYAYLHSNLEGFLNILEACRNFKVRHLVYASSSSVYGDEEHLPKQEGIEGTLLSPYALTKRADEEWAKQYTRHYGLRTVGLRYFNVFGQRQDPHGAYAAVIPKFIKQLLAGERPTIHGDGGQSRDFTYVENVIEANLKACLAPDEAAGEAFNIAYGGREYLIDIYHTLATALNKDIEPIFGPERPGDIRHSNADITKARRLLGYDPEYDFTRGLGEAIQWYKENL